MGRITAKIGDFLHSRRTFNGIKYSPVIVTQSSKRANKIAGKLRKKGFSVRLIYSPLRFAPTFTYEAYYTLYVRTSRIEKAKQILRRERGTSDSRA